jgi:hypothetical protein
MGTHRYHANVLRALDSPDNPLHAVLGVGNVRVQLARAKELRNRWKSGDDGAHLDRRGLQPSPLEGYNLEHILTTVFGGFDQALLLAEDYVRGLTAGGRDAGMFNWQQQQEEDDWGFMVDAMDWEAV